MISSRSDLPFRKPCERFHDPETLSTKELFIDYNISASMLARDGTKARDFYWRHNVFLSYVQPGETKTFVVELEPGFFSLRYGPEFIVDPLSDHRVERIDITHRDGRPGEKMQTVAPGSLTYNLTNASPARIIASALSVSAAERLALSSKPPGFSWGGSYRVHAFYRLRHSWISSRRKR